MCYNNRKSLQIKSRALLSLTGVNRRKSLLFSSSSLCI